jgi:peptidylprolyl isomerase/FKBP-type peptidyl-prolyl cis-trans isomerase FklB
MRKILTAVCAVLLLAACGQKKDEAATAKAVAAGDAFLAQNAKQEGVKTLPSGLQYKVVRSGPADGLRPQKHDEVKVNYEGKLITGEVFDSSYERGTPAAMPLDALIPGWIEALQLMRPGDEWILYVPPKLGYGDEDKGPIPANSVLIFRIELLGVLPAPGRIGQG